MLQTKHIYLRLVQEDDVDFLLSLRLNHQLSRYLNPVDDNKEKQLNWLKEYKQREAIGTDYYFVIVDKSIGNIGLIRAYDINHANSVFTWGSWIIKEEGRPKYAAIESLLLVYEFAFNELGLKIAKFDVRNDNTHVINFYKRFGANFIYKDELNHYFELTKAQYTQLKYNRYYTFLI